MMKHSGRAINKERKIGKLTAWILVFSMLFSILPSGVFAADTELVPQTITEGVQEADPTEEPTAEPEAEPTEEPTAEPEAEPTEEPTAEPEAEPGAEPTEEPTAEPSAEPGAEPTEEPTAEPSEEPTAAPTEEPAAPSAALQDFLTLLDALPTAEELSESAPADSDPAFEAWYTALKDTLAQIKAVETAYAALSEEEQLLVDEAHTVKLNDLIALAASLALIQPMADPVTNPVAEVTIDGKTTQYLYFNQACDAAGKAATAEIKLLCSTSIGKTSYGSTQNENNTTLDLNGKTLTTLVHLFVTSEGTTLTVKDSVGGGKIEGDYYRVIQLANGGNFVLESGTLENTCGGSVITSEPYEGSAVGGNITIKGGTVKTSGTSSSASAIYAKANLLISGGTVESSVGDEPTIYSGLNSEFTGGTVTNTGGASALYIAGKKVHIAGGSFIASGAGADSYGVKIGPEKPNFWPSLQLSGTPKISGKAASVYLENAETLMASTSNLTTDEYYEGDVITIFCRPGLLTENVGVGFSLVKWLQNEGQAKKFAVANSDSVFTPTYIAGLDVNVLYMNPPAYVATVKVGDKKETYHMNFDEAFANAKNGNQSVVVTLLENTVFSGGTLKSGNYITLDLNGKTLTNTSTDSPAFTVPGNAVLIVDNNRYSADVPGTISGGKGAAIRNDGGSIVLKGGNLTSEDASVFETSGGYVTMNGGAIIAKGANNAFVNYAENEAHKETVFQMKNGEIKSADGIAIMGSAEGIRGGTVSSAGGTAIVGNVLINGATVTSTGGKAIEVKAGNYVSIYSGTVKSIDSSAIEVEKGGTLYISGPTDSEMPATSVTAERTPDSTGTYYAIRNSGTTRLGGEAQVKTTSYMSDDPNAGDLWLNVGATLHVSDSSYTGNIIQICYADPSGEETTNGATFVSNVDRETLTARFPISNLPVSSDLKTKYDEKTKNITFTLPNYAATVQIGEGKAKRYKTLADAFKAATAEPGAATIQMLRDVYLTNSSPEEPQLQLKSGNDITLDLNGKELQHKVKNSHVFNLEVGAALTINDTSVEKTGKLEAIGTGSGAICNNGGMVTIKDGIICALFNHTVKNTLGTVLVEGGRIESEYNYHAVVNTADLKVSGGTFASGGTGEFYDRYDCTPILNEGDGTVTVTGGVMRGSALGSGICSTSTKAQSVSISGTPTIEGGIAGLKVAAPIKGTGYTGPDMTILYTNAPKADDIVVYGATAGFIYAKEEKEVFNLVPSNDNLILVDVSPEASANLKNYKTLKEALAAVKAGQTVTLLRDVTHKEAEALVIDKNVTLNLNGYTLRGISADSSLLNVSKYAELNITSGVLGQLDKPGGKIENTGNVIESTTGGGISVYNGVTITSSGDSAIYHMGTGSINIYEDAILYGNATDKATLYNEKGGIYAINDATISSKNYAAIENKNAAEDRFTLGSSVTVQTENPDKYADVITCAPIRTVGNFKGEGVQVEWTGELKKDVPVFLNCTDTDHFTLRNPEWVLDVQNGVLVLGKLEIELEQNGMKTSYASLNNALKAAKAGTGEAVIRLLADLSKPQGPTPFTADGANAVTLDLNGHDIWITDSNFLSIANGAAFTVKNSGDTGKINLITSTTYKLIEVNRGGTLTLDSVTVSGSGNSSTNGNDPLGLIILNEGATATFKNATLEPAEFQSEKSLLISSKGTLSIENSTLNGGSGTTLNVAGGKTTLGAGSNITASGNSPSVVMEKRGSLLLEGGTLAYTGDKAQSAIDNSKAGTVEIKDGTIAGAILTNTPIIGSLAEDYSGEPIQINWGKFYPTLGELVVQCAAGMGEKFTVTNKGYSLEETDKGLCLAKENPKVTISIDGAGPGEEMTLTAAIKKANDSAPALASITARGTTAVSKPLPAITGNITLYMTSGSSITYTGTADALLVTESTGKLTVTGTGTIDGGSAPALNNKAGATIRGALLTSAGNGGTIQNNVGGTLDMSNGTVQNTGRGCALDNSGSTEISGGAVTSQCDDGSLQNQTGGLLKLSKGTVQNIGHGVALGNSGSAEISGGTVSSISGKGALENKAGGTLNISGGTVKNIGDGIALSNSGSIEITGGTVTSQCDDGSFQNQTGGVLKLSKGTVQNTGDGVALGNSGSTEISGGTVLSKNKDGTVQNKGAGTLVLGGGTTKNTGSGAAINAKASGEGSVTVKMNPVLSSGSSADIITGTAIYAADYTGDKKICVHWLGALGATVVKGSDKFTLDAKSGYQLKADDNGNLVAQMAEFTLTYELNGGTAENPTTYTMETEDFTLNNPTRKNYTFTGWSGTGITGTSDAVTVKKGSVGDRSYKAVWKGNSYTVTLDYAGGEAKESSVSVNFGSAYGALPIPQYEGYGFTGWWTAKTGGEKITSQTVVSTDRAHTLYAQWADNVPPKVVISKPDPEWTANPQKLMVTYSDISGIKSAEYAIVETAAGLEPGTLQPLPPSGKALTVDKAGLSYLYYKITDTKGNITKGYSWLIKIDNSAPTATIMVNGRTVTLGSTAKIFCRDKAQVSIKGYDTHTYVKTVEYQKTTGGTLNPQGWLPYVNELPYSDKGMFTLYVRLTDKVGNQAILQTPTILVYSDSTIAPEDAKAEFNPNAPKDVSIPIAFAGNSLNQVKNGDKALARDVDYALEGTTLIIRQAYLGKVDWTKGLKLQISFNPMGERYTGYIDAPKELEISFVSPGITPTAIPTTSPTETPPTVPPVIKDDENGMELVGVDGTTLQPGTQLMATDKTEEFYLYEETLEALVPNSQMLGLYDIKLELDGVSIQPDGRVKVRVPLTEEMKAMKNLRVVYISEDGTISLMESMVQGDFIEFITNHFSLYGIVNEIKAEPTPTPTPGEATPTPTPGESTPTPIPGEATPTPTPGEATPTPTPGEVTPTPTPGEATPTPTPGEATPTPTPGEATPTPTPGEATPTPTPGEATPTPTPGEATPTPTPGEATPTPTPGEATPTPTPGEATPTPTPGEATPTPTPGEATPTPTPGEATPTPIPGEATPTPKPGETLDTPSTGDTDNQGILYFLFFVSAGAILLLAYKRRHKGKN